jgi:hypothetical protein
MKDKGQGLVGLTLALHWVGTRPSKGCRIHLCHFITSFRGGRSKHGVHNNGVWESLVAKHLVIGREAAGKCRIKAWFYPVLGCHDHCAFSTVRVNHPPGGQGLGVNRRNFARANVATKAQFILVRFCTQKSGPWRTRPSRNYHRR